MAPVNANCGGAAQIYVGDGVFIDGARPDVLAAYPAYPNNTRGRLGLHGADQHAAETGQWHVSVLPARTRSRRPHDAARHPHHDVRQRARDQAVRRDRHADAGRRGVGGGLCELRVGADAAAEDDSHRRVDDHGARGRRRRSVRSTTTTSAPTSQTLFPGYRTTRTEPSGSSMIDTTPLANGLHTISWTVTDNQGSTEGIGSRFFTVSNGAGALTAAVEGTATNRVRGDGSESSAMRLPTADRRRWGRRGWDLTAPLESSRRSRGPHVMRSEEMDRVELHLAAGTRTGICDAAKGWRRCRSGRSLDASTGVFTWAPGVGFVGRVRPRVRAVGGEGGASTKCALSSRRRERARRSAGGDRHTTLAAGHGAAVRPRGLGGGSRTRRRARGSRRCTRGHIR